MFQKSRAFVAAGFLFGAAALFVPWYRGCTLASKEEGLRCHTLRPVKLVGDQAQDPLLVAFACPPIYALFCVLLFGQLHALSREASGGVVALKLAGSCLGLSFTLFAAASLAFQFASADALVRRRHSAEGLPIDERQAGFFICAFANVWVAVAGLFAVFFGRASCFGASDRQRRQQEADRDELREAIENPIGFGAGPSTSAAPSARSAPKTAAEIHRERPTLFSRLTRGAFHRRDNRLAATTTGAGEAAEVEVGPSRPGLARTNTLSSDFQTWRSPTLQRMHEARPAPGEVELQLPARPPPPREAATGDSALAGPLAALRRAQAQLEGALDPP